MIRADESELSRAQAAILRAREERGGRPAAMRGALREAAFQNQLMIELCRRVDVRVWRVNASNGPVELKRGGFVLLAPEGAADITGAGPGGIRLEIETKIAPNKPNAAQLRWRDRMRMIGAFHIVATARADEDVESAAVWWAHRIDALLNGYRF